MKNSSLEWLWRIEAIFYYLRTGRGHYKAGNFGPYKAGQVGVYKVTHPLIWVGDFRQMLAADWLICEKGHSKKKLREIYFMGHDAFGLKLVRL